MEENLNMASHLVSFQNRELGMLTGIRDVNSFDEQVIVLDTDYGTVTIKGEALHVNRLDLEKGEIELQGNLDSVCYSKKGSPTQKNKEPILGRLFR